MSGPRQLHLTTRLVLSGLYAHMALQNSIPAQRETWPKTVVAVAGANPVRSWRYWAARVYAAIVVQSDRAPLLPALRVRVSPAPLRSASAAPEDVTSSDATRYRLDFQKWHTELNKRAGPCCVQRSSRQGCPDSLLEQVRHG